MKRVTIKRQTLGDTRTAARVPTFEEFNFANISHRLDVAVMMDNLAKVMIMQGEIHDRTKKEEPYRSLFYRELCAKIEGKMITATIEPLNSSDKSDKSDKVEKPVAPAES